MATLFSVVPDEVLVFSFNLYFLAGLTIQIDFLVSFFLHQLITGQILLHLLISDDLLLNRLGCGRCNRRARALYDRAAFVYIDYSGGVTLT
jgi:hypothetical protein